MDDMQIPLSKKITSLQPSPTLAIDAKVKELTSSGEKIINLSIGEPDFPTPDHIKQAAVFALEENFTHYTVASGIPELRKAIAHKLLHENTISYDPSQIIVGVGTKHILYELFQVLCNKGDEVLLATPTWSTYVEQIKLADATPVFIPLHPPFKLTAKDVKSHITKKTKILLLNSPSNPTGAVIDPSELKKIAELCVQNNILVISDEIYEKIVYGSTHLSIASLNDKIKNLTITVNGFSKAYAMTGWRIGYAAGPKEIIAAVNNLQGQMTSNTSSLSQKAAIAALMETQKPVSAMVEAFKKRQRFVVTSLSEIKGLDIVIPEGAFYVFVSVERLFSNNIQSSLDFCEQLLDTQKVAVVPGEAFFSKGFFRLSFAASMNDLKEGVLRIKNFVHHIS